MLVLATRILGYSIGVCVALSAVFTFWSRAQTQPEQSRVRAFFARIWRGIEDSTWLNLPEQVIRKLLRGRDFLSKVVEDPASFLFDLDVIGAPIVFGIVVWISSWARGDGLIYSMVISVIAVLIAYVVGFCLIFLGMSGFGFAQLYMFALSATTGILWIRLLLVVPLGLATALATLGLPIMWMSALGGAVLAETFCRDKRLHLVPSPVFALAVVTGIWITVLALHIGHALEPTMWVPRTLRLFVCNAVCDGLTVIITLKALEISIRHSKVLFIPLALVVSVALAATLGLGSMWCALVWTGHDVRLVSLLYAFVGRSPAGSRWQFGPNFCVMNTTFLPITTFAIFVAVCWLAKTFLIPVRWFFGKGQHRDINPLALTAGLLGLIAVGLSVVRQTIERFVK